MVDVADVDELDDPRRLRRRTIATVDGPEKIAGVVQDVQVIDDELGGTVTTTEWRAPESEPVVPEGVARGE